jgi:hypothetical protein
MPRSYTALPLVSSNDDDYDNNNDDDDNEDKDDDDNDESSVWRVNDSDASKDEDDEAATIDVAYSDDGYTMDIQGQLLLATLPTSKKHSKQRRIIRCVVCLILANVLVFFVVQASIQSRRTNRKSRQGGNGSVYPKEQQNTSVLCGGRSYRLAMDQWRNQQDNVTSSLCDPTVSHRLKLGLFHFGVGRWTMTRPSSLKRRVSSVFSWIGFLNENFVSLSSF